LEKMFICYVYTVLDTSTCTGSIATNFYLITQISCMTSVTHNTLSTISFIPV
jgi:hypothetical protein